MKNVCTLLLSLIVVIGTFSAAVAGLTKEEDLGELLYFDRFLSANQNQSCASCHDPGAGFADPLNLRLPDKFPTSAGSDTTLFGRRNAPPASYAMFSPPFGFDAVEGLYVGGQFWDGRAATLKVQAQGPFLNPVEMNMGSMANVIAALKDPENQNYQIYQELFLKNYKIDLAAINPPTDIWAVENAYDKLSQAIGEFEKTGAFAKFNSKFDAVMAGVEFFTPSEARGLTLFNGKAQCSLCHPSPLFTDFTYDNLGIPKSEHPLLIDNSTDFGLGAVLNDPLEDGKFKVSTLRNIALTPPYGHNGFFVTLKDIVHFYNTRDVSGAFGGVDWPEAEVTDNVNIVELGNLGLEDQEENDLVAFLKTLSDRMVAKSYPPIPRPVIP